MVTDVIHHSGSATTLDGTIVPPILDGDQLRGQAGDFVKIAAVVAQDLEEQQQIDTRQSARRANDEDSSDLPWCCTSRSRFWRVLAAKLSSTKQHGR